MTASVVVIEMRVPKGYRPVRQALIKGVIAWGLLALYGVAVEAILRIPFLALCFGAFSLPVMIVYSLICERRYTNYRTGKVPFELLEELTSQLGREFDPFRINDVNRGLLRKGYSRRDVNLIVAYCLKRINPALGSPNLRALPT